MNIHTEYIGYYLVPHWTVWVAMAMAFMIVLMVVLLIKDDKQK